VDDAAGKKKLLKPTWIGKKGRKDLPLPFTLNQKTVGSPEKACSYHVTKKAAFGRRNVHRDVINPVIAQRSSEVSLIQGSLSLTLPSPWRLPARSRFGEGRGERDRVRGDMVYPLVGGRLKLLIENRMRS